MKSEIIDIFLLHLIRLFADMEINRYIHADADKMMNLYMDLATWSVLDCLAHLYCSYILSERLGSNGTASNVLFARNSINRNVFSI